MARAVLTPLFGTRADIDIAALARVSHIDRGSKQTTARSHDPVVFLTVPKHRPPGYPPTCAVATYESAKEECLLGYPAGSSHELDPSSVSPIVWI